ncbi:50S ribosomal protein L29 [Candidatus Pacearchaeota archaeon CG10_big_fil_rev_8_21_14_0_10_32_42]|nr:MAG: 50S ribosomal protein L29 [Candidatus Pacearchaeota archaeon CG10_big_fil_rev_8_21_14_0_10_32_42]
MAILKAKDIRNMSKNERENKLKELKLELIKSRGKASQGGSLKTREIKKTIARLLTIK